MAGLKELRTRIETIKSTEKITSAMKMVAAARLRRSQGLIEKCRFYNNNILASANRVLFELRQEEQKKNVRFVYPELMRGSGKAENYLLLVFTSDRGLCGSDGRFRLRRTIAAPDTCQKQQESGRRQHQFVRFHHFANFSHLYGQR